MRRQRNIRTKDKLPSSRPQPTVVNVINGKSKASLSPPVAPRQLGESLSGAVQAFRRLGVSLAEATAAISRLPGPVPNSVRPRTVRVSSMDVYGEVEKFEIDEKVYQDLQETGGISPEDINYVRPAYYDAKEIEDLLDKDWNKD